MTIHPTQQLDTYAHLSVAELRRRGSGKWSYHESDVLAAWVAEMDFPLAPVIHTALHDAIDRGCTGYPPRDAALPNACAAWVARKFGVAVEPRQVRVLPDILRGIELALDAFSSPDSAVVVMTPSYPPFFETVRVTGRPLVEVPMIMHAGRLTFDLDAIDSALRAGARTVILCNPHNPVGRVFTRAELGALATLVESQGGRVIADEVHAPLVYSDGTHVSYSTVSELAARHSVTLVSASKAWNIPGLVCAQILLTNEADIERWERLSSLRTHGASILGILANTVAYEQGEAWLQDVVRYLDGNRTLLAQLLADYLPAVRYTPPEGTYLAWLDCTALGLDDPADFFLKHAKVALSSGAGFGRPGQGHVRLNFATSRDILTTIARNMADAVVHRSS